MLNNIFIDLLQQNRMQKKPGSKTPLCNFINNCRQFKLNGQCKFLHAKCKEGAQCTYGEKCRYYHPERTGISRPPRQQQQRGKSKRNLSQIQCQFGLKCRKKQFNQCPYNHDNLPSLPSQKPMQMLCKYGDRCKNFAQGTCKYKHIDYLNKSQVKQQTFQKHMSIQQSKIQNYDKNNNQKLQYNAHQIDNNVQFRQFEQKKICPRFAIGQCDQQQCSQTHQFTLDNSIKRLYFKVFQQQGGSNKIFCRMFKLNGNRLFALTRDNILSFYELDDENQILKTVCASQLRLQSTINSLHVESDPENKNFVIILTTQNNKIHRFYPLEGKIESMNFPQSSHVSQTGCFGYQNIIFAGNKVTQMLVLKDQKKDPIIIQKLSQNSPDVINGTVKIIRKFSLLGENFLVIGTKLGYLSLINKQFSNKSIQIPNVTNYLQQSTIYDICTTTLSSKPFAFAVVSRPINSSGTNLQKYQIVSINLLNFSMESVLSTDLFEISTVCCVYDRIFVGINQVGVLVYSLSDLSKIKGRIPMGAKITFLQGDNDGNLLICSQNTQQNQISSTISVYKIRK